VSGLDDLQVLVDRVREARDVEPCALVRTPYVGTDRVLALNTSDGVYLLVNPATLDGLAPTVSAPGPLTAVFGLPILDRVPEAAVEALIAELFDAADRDA
jgi:hypothetical protein